MSQQKNDSERKKLEYCLKLHNELHHNYELVTKLCIVCIDRGIRLIIENPYGQQHYLTRYWCLKPKVIDHNRRDRGDAYEKPTQYWFVNFDPSDNFIFEPIKYYPTQKVVDNGTVDRSMITKEYANRFIREFIL